MNAGAKIAIFLIEFLIWLASIAVGGYLGGICIGFAGGLAVALLCYGFQEPVGSIPWEVIQIILAVVCLTAAVQAAGGMEYMVRISERILRSQPQYITFLAPVVVWVLTIVCGTGYIFFAILPVVAEVAKSVGVRPSRPLTTASLAAMFGVVASPLSSAIVIITDANEVFGRRYSYLQLLAVLMPSTLVGLLLTSIVVSRLGKDLWKDEDFLRRYRAGLVKGVGGMPKDFRIESDVEQDGGSTRVAASLAGDDEKEGYESPLQKKGSSQSVHSLPVGGSATSFQGLEVRKSLTVASPRSDISTGEHQQLDDEKEVKERPPLPVGARRSVVIFCVGMIGAMVYAIIYSRLNDPPQKVMPTDIGQGIVIFSLATALAVSLACRLKSKAIVDSPLFRAGLTAAVSVLGIAWAGSTLVEAHLMDMISVASDWIQAQSWIIFIVCFIMASLMASQAATARVFIPAAFSMGVSPYECLIAYTFCTTIYLLPASPSIMASINLDDTGTTKTGRFVLDHTMMIPGLLNTAFTVGCVALLGWAIGSSEVMKPQV